MWLLRVICYIDLMIVELSAAYEGNVPARQIQRQRNAIWKGVEAWFCVAFGDFALFKQEWCVQRAVRIFVNRFVWT